MLKSLALIPAMLLLTACGAAESEPQVLEPTPSATQEPVTSTPGAEVPEPVTSPKPTGAPNLLNVDAQVLSLAEIDPAIAQEHGFLPTDYYPLQFDPSKYCSVEDITVCGSSEELWAAFEEDFDQWVDEGGMEPADEGPITSGETQQEWMDQQ